MAYTFIDENTIISENEDNNEFGGGSGDQKCYVPPAVINCELQVTLSPKNTAIYVCRGSKQCFDFTALSCCGKGNIKIEYTGQYNANNGVIHVDKFGTFFINVSGICFKPDNDNLGKIGPGHITDVDLYFKASACGIRDIPFVIHFVYDPCKCCCKCDK